MFSKICLCLAFSLSLVAISESDVMEKKTNGENLDGFYPHDLFLSYHVYDLSINFIGPSLVLIYRSLERFYLGFYFSIDDQSLSNWTFTIKITNHSEKNYFNTGENDIEISWPTISQSPKPEANFSTSSKSFNTTNLSTSDVDESKQQDEHCGEPRVRIKRIIGGQNSSFGRRPWQVALFKPTSKDKPYCGGALLTDRWIITAAHCVDNKPIKILTVRLGELRALRKKYDPDQREYKVCKKEVHPRYSDKRHHYDLALLKLDRIVYFERNIIPVCLPREDLNLIGRRATVTGWGERKMNDKKSRPAILNEVDIEVIPNQVCQKWFSEAGHVRTISDIFLCAGQSSGGRDSCKGDSGGPLTTSVNKKEVLIGIVSWGFGCGEKHSPGIYTNIKKFLPWIRRSISQ